MNSCSVVCGGRLGLGLARVIDLEVTAAVSRYRDPGHSVTFGVLSGAARASRRGQCSPHFREGASYRTQHGGAWHGRAVRSYCDEGSKVCLDGHIVDSGCFPVGSRCGKGLELRHMVSRSSCR